jgi:uncharacterized protein with FMN-binding domain
MRRAIIAALGLIASVTLLLSLKSAPGATRPPDQVPADRRVADPSASGPPFAGGPPTGGPSPEPSAQPAPEASPSAAPDGQTFTGNSVYTEFGYVTVQITVSNGRIIDVTAVEMPTDEARSAALSSRVEPILRQRALSAQSANFDTASGATWTSEAYQASLQSAIVKAGLG